MRILVAIALLLAAPASVSAADAGAVTRGKALVARTGCWQCHGYQGQGATTGPRLANTELDVAAMTAFIRTTKKMPSYSPKVLSDADIADIHAYFTALPPPASPDSIPLLKGLKPGT